MMLAAEIALPYGAIFRRDLEIEKNNALLRNFGNYESLMVLSFRAKHALIWWANNVQNSFSPIRRYFDLELETDASLDGWGAFCPTNNFATQGQWTEDEKICHINVLELKAVFFALKALCSQLCGKHIRIKSDNTSVVSCLNKFGSCHSPDLHALSREIWFWCIDRSIWLSAQHIPGKQNSMADNYSRKFNLNTDWMLDASVFNSLISSFFYPDVDLFASRFNKIQAWYHKMLDMLIDFPIILPMTSKILSLPSSDRKHPLSHNMTLLACRLSGNVYKSEEFRSELSTSLPSHGDHLHRKATIQPSGNGYSSVLKGKLIRFVQM